jgi:gamma-D-glutamyl-L-lysine dipeptidyl-peptidase
MSDVLEVRVPVATMWASPHAPRDVDAGAVLANPDIAAWSASVLTQDLIGRTLTQLLMGEPVRVLEERGDWVLGAALWQLNGPSRGELDDGYLGWLRRAHLGSPVARTEGATAFVMVMTATCEIEHEDSVELSFGTAFWVDGVSETSVLVLLPDGRRGALRPADVRLSDKSQQPTHRPGDELGLARQLLGLRYVWGGTSAWGVDCSGLVHLTHRALGVVIARDACDQAAGHNVVPVSLDHVRPGDLYFFAKPGAPVTHVGYATRGVQPDGSRWMLHSPQGGGVVEEGRMAPERLAMLVSAGRVRVP